MKAKRLLLLSLMVIVLMALMIACAQPETCKLQAGPDYTEPVYQAPDTGAPVVATLADGAVVLVLENQGDWHRVQTQEGITGWIQTRELCR